MIVEFSDQKKMTNKLKRFWKKTLQTAKIGYLELSTFNR